MKSEFKDKIRDDWKIYLSGTNDIIKGSYIRLKPNSSGNRLRITGDEVQLFLMVGTGDNTKKAKSTEGKLWLDY